MDARIRIAPFRRARPGAGILGDSRKMGRVHRFVQRPGARYCRRAFANLQNADQQTADSAPMIRLEDVGRRFGKRVVFSSVCLSASPGEVVAITGSNGSGKSTLLRIIAGLLPPSSGTCRFTVYAGEVPAIQRRQFLGYVAPDYSLYRDLTGTENIRLFAELRGRRIGRNEVRDLLTRTGLRGRGRDMAATYSSGMRQRLKYACALAGDPAVLLLDEPGANLDPAGSDMVRLLIEAQRSRAGGGITMLATNEVTEVEWADRAITLTQKV